MEDTGHHSEAKTVAASTDAMHAHAVTAHPLQDVDLRLDDADIPDMQPQSKGNWVKFDDDINEKSENKNNIQNNNNNVATAVDSASANATKATPTPTPATSANRLSPIPPPAPAARHSNTRARTPSESTTLPTPLETQHHQLAAPPGQRSPVSAAGLPDVAPAVLTTESTHVNLNASGKAHQQQSHQNAHPSRQPKPRGANSLATTGGSSGQRAPSPHAHHSNNGAPASKSGSTSVAIPIESAPTMRTIELSTGRIREGFANGDVIVTLLPANTKWPWITPAIFRPELVPEELMAQGLTLTVEEYVSAMETLVNDYRFTVYNICYKRILVVWILFAFSVLLTLLFSGLQGVALFSLGVGWLFLNAAAIFLCMWVKLRLSRNLEKCLARVNKQLMKHKILLVLDDRGRISCHKVNLCFLYFDATQCVGFLKEFLEHTEQTGGEAIKAGWEAKLDIDLNDIVIQGSNPVRLSRKQAVAEELFLSYLQRWGKDFLRRRLDWTVQEAGVHETPRHLQSSICPCQYEEEVLRNKIKMHLQRKQCCGINCIGCWL